MDVVALLLGHASTMLNSTVNIVDDRGLTPLHWAVSKGCAGVVALLLNCPGINVNETDEREETALHLACYAIRLDPDILRKLLTHPDIDPNVKRFGDGRTPIMLLLQRNYNIDEKEHCLRAMVESNRVDLEVKDAHGLSLNDMAW